MRLAATTAALMLGLVATPAFAQFKLTSPDVAPGSTIGANYVANVFGCSGQNVSPALAWSGAPAGTKSFVLTVYDPDAPTGSGFWHWVIYDIPASVTKLPEGAGADGKQPAGAVLGENDYGAHAYGGPCPPPGDTPHHYIFTIYAMGAPTLSVPPNPTSAVVGFMTHAGMIGKASFTARYGR